MTSPHDDEVVAVGGVQAFEGVGEPALLRLHELSDAAPPSLVQAQYAVAADGTFLFVTRALQLPIGFRMHQYEAVDVALKKCSGKVVDVGTITLKKLPTSQLRSVKGKIVLKGSADASAAELRFQVALPPLNSIRSILRNSDTDEMKMEL